MAQDERDFKIIRSFSGITSGTPTSSSDKVEPMDIEPDNLNNSLSTSCESQNQNIICANKIKVFIL